MDFSKHIQKADEALRRRNFDFAIDVYRELLDIDPDLAEARAALRQAYRKKLEAKGGSKLLRAVGGAVPLATAKTLRKAGKHVAAAKQLEAYLASNPLDEDGNLLLGMSLEDAGHFKSAAAVYEFLAEIAPKSAEGLKRAGAMMYKTGDHRRALEYYERALEADPRDQEALKARKNLAAETALSGGFEEVAHSRERIVDKAQAQRLEREQRRHLSQEDLEQELARLEQEFAAEPSDPERMLALAAVHERLGDYEAALELAERAQSYRRDSFDLVCRVGDLRSKVAKKRLARADKDGDAALAARLEHELWQSEVEDYAGRVRLRPADAALRVQLGRRLMRLERLDEALAEFQKAQADPRAKGEAVFHLAQCFQRKGFLDLARGEFERALESAPAGDERTKEILYNLGAISESQGDRDGAKRYYTRVYQVDIGYRDVASKMEQFK